MDGRIYIAIDLNNAETKIMLLIIIKTAAKAVSKVSFKRKLIAAYNDMLDVKTSLGYNRHNYMSHILPFIDFCSDNYPNASEITKEMLDQWLMSRSFNTDNTRRIAIINIRHYTRYLKAIGKNTYIPSSEYNVKVRRYRPYIFTESEISLLFTSIDSLTNRKDYEASHPEIILPVVFRMELCCGMRPSEPLNLKVEDVNLKTGDVFIRKSKRGKSRHIVMSEDMKQLCVVYYQFANEVYWSFVHNDNIAVIATCNSGYSVRANIQTVVKA